MNQPARGVIVAVCDLDGHPVPDWVTQTLTQAGIDLRVRQCTTQDELSEHARDAEIVWLFGGSRLLHGGTLAKLPNCRAIVRTGSGTDNVPVDEATERGIVVANTPAALSDAVSDHVIALLFAMVRHVPRMDRLVRSGVFDQNLGRPINLIQGRTFGLVGFGHIARAVLRKLRGFEMTWLVYDPYVSESTLVAHGARPAALDEVLSESDFVSLHCPLTPQTRHLIGERELRLMKPDAVLVNAARGAVVDEPVLIRALQEKWIAAACLDAFEQEPLPVDSPLFQLENVILAPHSPSHTAEWMEPRWRASVDAVLALASHHWPPSCVNRQVQPVQPLTLPS